MPGWLYRWYYHAHSVRSLQRNVLRFIGFRHVKATLIGSVGNMSKDRARACLDDVRALGAAAR